jgi:hypothetical protein
MILDYHLKAMSNMGLVNTQRRDAEFAENRREMRFYSHICVDEI